MVPEESESCCFPYSVSDHLTVTREMLSKKTSHAASSTRNNGARRTPRIRNFIQRSTVLRILTTLGLANIPMKVGLNHILQMSIHADGVTAGVKLVTKLATDLNCILKTSLPQKRGSDGKTYHVINFAIKVTHYSAHTKYELLHQGHNYGQVKAENV